MPSANFAVTFPVAAGRGNQTVRVNMELPVNDRSTESLLFPARGWTTVGPVIRTSATRHS